MNNVIKCLENNLLTALQNVKHFRRWAKDGGGKKDWETAFKNLSIAKEFKRAITLIKFQQ